MCRPKRCRQLILGCSRGVDAPTSLTRLITCLWDRSGPAGEVQRHSITDKRRPSCHVQGACEYVEARGKNARPTPEVDTPVDPRPPAGVTWTHRLCREGALRDKRQDLCC